uniref:hypothetical protein n=1 Tax=Paractinoplanes polyasparticus TaxID=2856853 RepID=UPI001C849FE1|nr:hypothetical protein [Actinoplanes polyasparticus]
MTAVLAVVFLGAAMVAVVVAGPGSAAATVRRGVTGRFVVALAAADRAAAGRAAVAGFRVAADAAAGLRAVAAAAGLRAAADAEDFVD